VTWVTAFAALGVVFGFLATSVTDLLRSNPATARVLAGDAAGASNFVFAFVVTILQLTGLIAAIAGVQIMNRIVVEEHEFRVEPLLATALRRQTYLASNIAVAFLVPAVCLLIGATVIGIVATGAGVDIAVGDVIAQAAVTVAAVWVLIALACAAVGARPQLRLAGWLAIVATFGLTILGPTFKLPNWALSISPLRHIPVVTARTPNWPGLALLCAVVVVFTAIAFAGFGRRDIA
ncbi:MAG TPA: multidrug ABC transporter permease, partial [Mycobacterium sp.]|nr:multidrug ABC transporter permease [Mycobacterium sp.]